MALLIRKQPAEKFVQFIDFEPLLGVGELASTTPIVWGGYRTPTLLAGDATDAATIVATALHSSTGVNLTLQQGTADNWYKVNVLVSTSGGNVWEDELIIEVRES